MSVIYFNVNTEKFYVAFCTQVHPRQYAVVSSLFYCFLGGLDNVEYYDIKMNEWKMVSPMPWKGVTVKCAAVGSIVYVLAGFQGVGRLGHILEYNTETDKWIANSKVRAFPVTSCLICVVDTCGANEETLET